MLLGLVVLIEEDVTPEIEANTLPYNEIIAIYHGYRMATINFPGQRLKNEIPILDVFCRAFLFILSYKIPSVDNPRDRLSSVIMDKNTTEARSGRLRIPKDTKAVPRDDPNLELLDGELSDTDPRNMSPRRDDTSTERVSEEAKQTLQAEKTKISRTLSDLDITLTDAFEDLENLEKRTGNINQKLKQMIEQSEKSEK
ncbi:hypothetical protein UA08_09479 [Talaromyces atroroseus]|uniref:Uncharacterized protein n=1 Tax=Talaromyces atroroseus TaxID=1441469 RepID=A0A1Q5Q604_TALAT|nr:hypothetical protein UA08_09479 [Talaromyces atroroseus]OKL55258.1 hypothetical protein UA08_09479 [Talaromyces atroroseus]